MGERTILKLRREAEERLGKCEECLLVHRQHEHCVLC